MSDRLVRIPPLLREDWAEEQWQILASLVEALPTDFQGGAQKDSDYTAIELLLNHPMLAKAYLGYSQMLLIYENIPARERELIVLRVAYLSQSEYEWAQHVRICQHEEIPDEVILRVKAGAGHPDWSEKERYLLASVDELVKSAFISEESWTGLSGYYNTEQLMEIMFVVGNYLQIAMMFNTMGAQLNPKLRDLLEKFPLD